MLSDMMQGGSPGSRDRTALRVTVESAEGAIALPVTLFGGALNGTIQHRADTHKSMAVF